MKQKERLVELLKNAGSKAFNEICVSLDDYYNQFVNYLLQNGVIVLPEIKDGMCFDEFLYETDKIVTEYYCKKTGQGV